MDERLEEKVNRAVKASGWPKADILRFALHRGLDDLELIGYDIDGAIAAAVRSVKESTGSQNGPILLESQELIKPRGRKAT